MAKTMVQAGCALLSGFVFACAAQQQQGTQALSPDTSATAAPQVTEPKTPSPGTESVATTTEDAPTEAATPEPTREPEPAPAPPQERTFDPIAALTATGTAFVIDYAHSGARQFAEKQCEPRVSDKKDVDEDELAEKRKECLAKERAKFTADVIRFRLDAKGNGFMAIYRRVGSQLPEVYVAKVAYQVAEKGIVKVAVKGGTTGARPVCRDRAELIVKVPNDYSIELDDPLYGALPYDAKVGLVGG